MSNNNYVSIKGIVNKPGILKQTQQGIPYVGLSVGIPRHNKNTNSTEYMNVYVKVWRDAAQQFTVEGCKGAYRFIGEINAYQNTSGNGQSQTITELVVQSAEKIEYRPQNNNQYRNPNPNQNMPAGNPAKGPNSFQNQPQQARRPQNNNFPQQPNAPVYDERGCAPGEDPYLPF